MIADRIKHLRESNGLSQDTLAKKLGITRSAVNAWEMGLNIPSPQFIVEMADLFKVSTDLILCLPETSSINVDGLTDDDINIIYEMIKHLRRKNQKEFVD